MADVLNSNSPLPSGPGRAALLRRWWWLAVVAVAGAAGVALAVFRRAAALPPVTPLPRPSDPTVRLSAARAVPAAAVPKEEPAQGPGEAGGQGAALAESAYDGANPADGPADGPADDPADDPSGGPTEPGRAGSHDAAAPSVEATDVGGADEKAGVEETVVEEFTHTPDASPSTPPFVTPDAADVPDSADAPDSAEVLAAHRRSSRQVRLTLAVVAVSALVAAGLVVYLARALSAG